MLDSPVVFQNNKSTERLNIFEVRKYRGTQPVLLKVCTDVTFACNIR